MNIKTRNHLLKISAKKMLHNDPSHDIHHATRVLDIAEKIAKTEGADLDIIVPAAIFHDVICYPKNHPKRYLSSRQSAEYAKKVLSGLSSFPEHKIQSVFESIDKCSFTKAQVPASIEARIIQDADSLEALGAIAIMRTFASAGSMNKSFFDPIDPFCLKRYPDDGIYALDLFFTRLLIIESRLHTMTAKRMSKSRVVFLKLFLKQLKLEILSNKE